MTTGHILLDTYPAQVEQWCWRPEWHAHGESAWSLFGKFALLNQLTTRELVTLIVNYTCRKRTTIFNKPNVDLRDGSVFDLPLLATLFRVPPARIRNAFLFEALPGSALRSFDHLRWCNQCMARAFHSPLFQMRMTRECPLHEHALVEHCPRCERQIPYRLTKEFLLKPFCCPHCGNQLAPTMSDERPEVLRLRKEHISRLAALLKFHKFANADLLTVSDAQRLFINAGEAGIAYVSIHECDIHSRYAGFITQVLEDVAPGLHPRQKGLRLEPVVRQEYGRWRQLSWEDDDELADAVDGGGAQAGESEASFQAALATYKAIRRRLWRQVLRKHQRCIASAAQRLWWNMDGERTNGFCPHALAYLRWRMLWEGCGTPRYLFARRTKDYYGIIGWHLARPSPAPRHWSTGTKAWISSHIFGSTCLIAFNDMQRWAKEVCRAGTVSWDLPKGPVNHSGLWAVAGRDCRDRPAVVYVKKPPDLSQGVDPLINYSDHWKRHEADIATLRR